MIAEKGDKKGTNKSDLKMCCWKKPFALVLLLVMAATLLLAFLPQPALAQTPITTCTELQNMSLTGDYYLGNDIDCTCTSGWNAGAGFEPIGTDGSPFTGTFDGQGYKITGLYINRGSTDFVGLFGFTGPGSEITNVGLEQVDFSGDYWVVGGLVGVNEGGTITNSYWDIITSGQLSSAGGEGKTTTEMKQRATFENWDFVNIWAIVEAESYPYLQWQPEPPIPVPVFSITGLVVVIGMMCLVLAVTVSRRRR